MPAEATNSDNTTIQCWTRIILNLLVSCKRQPVLSLFGRAFCFRCRLSTQSGSSRRSNLFRHFYSGYGIVSVRRMIRVLLCICSTCVLHKKRKNAVQPTSYNVKYYWNRGFVKNSTAQFPVGCSALYALRWRRAPHWRHQMTHHVCRSPTKSWYSLICGWFCLGLAGVGEFRYIAAM